MDRQLRELTVSKPFSLKATALSHGWHECAPMSWCEGGRCLQLIERAGDQACRVSVTEASGRKGRAALDVVIEGETVNARRAESILARVAMMLDLDRDLSEFHALCRKHPRLTAVPRIGAGRLIRSASMTENILKMLCATNVNWTQAVKMINRLAQLGRPFRHFVYLSAWPTPREILRAGEPYLKEVCRLGYRTDSILTFCDDVCEGRIDPDELFALAADPECPSDDILARLRSIKGIGPSSAHALLSLLGRHDRLAIDSATVAHVARTHTKGRKPTGKQIERIYAPYGKWRNLVYWCESWLNWRTAQQIVEEAGHRSRER